MKRVYCDNCAVHHHRELWEITVGDLVRVAQLDNARCCWWWGTSQLSCRQRIYDEDSYGILEIRIIHENMRSEQKNILFLTDIMLIIYNIFSLFRYQLRIHSVNVLSVLLRKASIYRHFLTGLTGRWVSYTFSLISLARILLWLGVYRSNDLS